MDQKTKLTKDIHNSVRGHLSWEESLRLLEEIVESEEWMQNLEIEVLLYHMSCKKQEMEGSNPPFPKYY